VALPKKIAPYSYRDQEHQNRVNWRVDPARAALLVHDMQRYFVRAFELERDGQTLPDAQINIAIANIRRLVDAAHAANIPVYYTAQPPRQLQITAVRCHRRLRQPRFQPHRLTKALDHDKPPLK